MSHSHTHAPGEEHSHSHGSPQPPVPLGLPTPDPILQALIDQDFIPVPLTLSSDTASALCASHKLEKCDDCNLDFVNTNRLAKLLIANPNLLCPPPSNVITQKLTQLVQTTKDEGNALFKRNNASQAIVRYTAAASLAIQRPPWEANQFMREELSTAISNRSAAYYDMRDYLSALADAETVIAIRRNWNKGHFRKAKALLGFGRLQDAVDAVRLGLDYEPTNAELLSFAAELERMKKKQEAEARSVNTLLSQTVSATATA